MFAAFAANATNATKSAAKQQKKSKSAEKERKQAQAKPRKELVKVSSKDLTCEQMRELLGFGEHDSHDRRVAELALLAGVLKVLTLSLRFDIELRPAQRDAAGSASEAEHDDNDHEQAEQPTLKVLTGARLVALDKTVHIPLDANDDGKPVLYQESVQAAVSELLGIDAQNLEEYCFLYTGANPVRDDEDLARIFGAPVGHRELQFRTYFQCDLCGKPICQQKGPTLVCEHKFNGHVLAACTSGGCFRAREFALPSGTLTLARTEHGLEAAFAPTGQEKPARLTADFVSQAAEAPAQSQEGSQAQGSQAQGSQAQGAPAHSGAETEDDEPTDAASDAAYAASPADAASDPECVVLSDFDDDDEPILPAPRPTITIKREREQEPQPEPEKKPKEPPAKKQKPKEQKPKEPEPKEPPAKKPRTEPNRELPVDDKLPDLILALWAAMPARNAADVIATVARFWHVGVAGLAPCVQDIVALNLPNFGAAIALVAQNWHR